MAALSDRLDARVMLGFSESLLAPRYDEPRPVAYCHIEMWREALSGHLHNAFAMPREHGKSTSVTHALTLALVLFKVRDFGLIVSDTETQAIDFLGDIRDELLENQKLRETFEFDKLLKDTETRLIGKFKNGDTFRIDAKGAEQKLRGIKWKRRRPNFIIGDDMENDEMVMSPPRREKVRRWFMRALSNCGSSRCLHIILGTILHEDSLLNRLMSDPTWNSLLRKAHHGINDFSDILWPEQWSEDRLRTKKLFFQSQNDLGGYAKEFLNEPVAEGETYFRSQDFQPMKDDQRPDKNRMRFYAAIDMAISVKEKADYTVIVVAGMDADGQLFIVDVRRGRWDALDIIDEMFSVQTRYKPEIFTVETEKIDKALGPFLEIRMNQPGQPWINIVKMTPSGDKPTRGRTIQAMMKAGSCYFDTEADWYDDFYQELMMMTDEGMRATHDDHFDAFAYIGKTIDQYGEAATEAEFAEEQYMAEFQRDMGDMGRDAVTGY